MHLLRKGSRIRKVGAWAFGKAKWGFGLGLTVLGIIGSLLGIPDLNRQVRTDVPLIRCWFPVAMDRTKFTVVMTPLVTVDERGRVRQTRDGRELANHLYTRLEASFNELDLPIPSELRGPQDACAVVGRDRDARAAAAEALAQEIDADLVIYGAILQSANGALYQPEFYVRYNSFDEASDLVGPHELGRPLRVSVPINAQDLKAVAEHPVNVRARALSLITLGLAAVAVDDHATALAFFTEAEQMPAWSAGAGKELVYLLMGNAASNLAATTLDAAYVNQALDYYEEALALEPTFARALVGLAGATYQQALGNLQTRRGSDVLLDRLEEAEILYETALETPAPAAAEIEVKAHFGLGQIYLVRHYVLGGEWLDRARAEFRWLIAHHAATPVRARDLVGHAYARLGLIAAQWDDDVPAAIPLYLEAVALVTPRWQAVYHLDLGDLYVRQEDREHADFHYHEALGIAELHGKHDLVARAEEKLAALRR